MKLNEYQNATLATAVYPRDNAITYCALGLCGEAGEVAEKIKKVIRDENSDFSPGKRQEIALELGDVLWYISQLADEIGYPLDEIAEMNIDKLRSRQERSRLHGSGDDR